MNHLDDFTASLACEELTDFAPTHADFAASLGDDEITALYASPAAPTVANDLFALFSAPTFSPLTF